MCSEFSEEMKEFRVSARFEAKPVEGLGITITPTDTLFPYILKLHIAAKPQRRTAEAVQSFRDAALCANISETTLPWKLEYNREGGGGQNVSRQSGRGCDT